MDLNNANIFLQAAEMIHKNKITKEQKLLIKAMFIEALIDFTNIYAQIEIGDSIEMDLQKISLYVNSPIFENEDVFYIKNIEDIYKRLEFEVLNGLPLWRFLKLTKYQNKIFEGMYSQTLKDIKDKKEKLSPCYTCVWYNKFHTDFGTIEECKKSSWLERNFGSRSEGCLEPEKVKHCKFHTTLENVPDMSKYREFERNKILRDVEYARERFNRNIEKLEDIYMIPEKMNNEDMINLEKDIDIWEDFGRAYRNKRTITERKKEIRMAMYLEGMYRFFECYAKMEIGNEFVPNVKEIVLYIDNLQENKLNTIMNIEDVYTDIENLILSGYDIQRFVKKED